MKFQIVLDALLLGALVMPSQVLSAPAEVPQTGQKTCYDASFPANEIACPGSHQDGEFQAGVLNPSPRFTDNGNGTVTDNLTGLIWLKNANCFGNVVWLDAINSANTLNSGECGLSDGSTEGWWRLPNIRELRSLADYAYHTPPLSNAAGTGHWQEGDPFINVQIAYNNDTYWSSTTYAANTDYAWTMRFQMAWDGHDAKNDEDYASFAVWPVQVQRIE